MSILTREEILAADDLVHEQVHVPEWGGTVLVAAMSGRARDEFESSLLASRSSDQGANMRNLRARLAALTCVDEDGARLFSKEDVDSLGSKSAAALDRIFQVAQKVNGIGDDAGEELAGN